MSHSANFTRLITEDLRSPVIGETKAGHHVITGILDTRVTLARITICVPPDFLALKRYPPLVVCHEPWMRKGADWHNDGTLCWVLPNEWHDAMTWRGKSISAIFDEGRRWLLEGVRCLINRHYCAHLLDLTEWSSEWAAWGHGKDGVREYNEAKRRSRTASDD